jgi:DNA polymerase III alpha subunit
LSEIKDVGEKASEFIVEERKKNGVFTSYDNFYDRCKCRVVTSRVMDKLKEEGALEFDKKIYINRVTKYNSALYSRAMK